MIAALLLALIQQDEVIPRASKQIYHPAVLSCEKAEGLIDSDPKEAIRLLDEILGNARIEKRECRMKIVIQPGTESKWFEFFPNQFRARASLKLADAAQGEDKVRHLDQAVQFLKKSTDLGLKTSEPLLKSAREKLERARLAAAGGEDPEVPFRRGWTELLDAGRFVEAKAHVESRGQFLAPEKRAEYVAETDKRCVAAVGKAVDRFVAELLRLESARDLADFRQDDFDRAFALPERETLVQSIPKYEWAGKMRAVLTRHRGGEEALTELFDRAIEAVAFVEAGESPAFRAADKVTWAALVAAVRRRADEARTAAADRRKALRAEAEALGAQWDAFQKRARAAGSPEALKGVPARQPAGLLAEFPVDVSLDAVLAALDASVTAEDPERALGETEKAIRKLLEGSERLTVESRRRILSLAVVARSLRGFLAEETPDEIALAARAVASELPQLGGPVDEVKRYGPKVAEVFKRLR